MPRGTAQPERELHGATVGRRIHAAMLRAGVNKADLARLCEVTWPSVNSWVLDRKRPSDDNLERAAEVLGVSRDWLKTGKGPTGPRNLDPRVQAAVDAFLQTAYGKRAGAEDVALLRGLDFGELEPDPDMIRDLWRGMVVRRERGEP